MMDFDIKLYAAAIALTGCLLPLAAQITEPGA